MKNYESILSEAGVTLDDKQKEAVAKGMQENYKPISDWQNQVDKVKSLEEKVKTTEEAMKKFDGVDADALKKQISDLQADLKKKDDDYASKIAERDFKDLVNSAITEAKGKNAKAISALLDMESLKGSKNQKEDVTSALKALSEAEDSKMLFGEPESNPVGTINTVGTVGKPNVSLDGVEKAFLDRNPGMKID